MSSGQAPAPDRILRSAQNDIDQRHIDEALWESLVYGKKLLDGG
jgi:hypothetical protein